MFMQNVSSARNVNFKGNEINSKDSNTTQPQSNIKDGKKKLALALAALGAAAVAGVAIYKGKGTKLRNVTFNKGIAFSQNGDKFTGKIKDKLANGDNIVMEYVDGVLQKSVRSGQVNFEKVYETVNNEKIVKKTINGVTTEFNITKTQQKVKTNEAVKSALKRKPVSSVANPNAQGVKYRRKFKQNGVNVTEFYEGDKLVKMTTSQAFPEQKYVKIKTEYPNGGFEDQYFMMGNKRRSILVQDGFNAHLDAQITTGGKLKPEAPKYDISFADGGSYGTSFANNVQEVQEFVDKLGLPFKIDNLGTSKASQMNFIAKNMKYNNLLSH